jgi:hypothetical protein
LANSRKRDLLVHLLKQSSDQTLVFCHEEMDQLRDIQRLIKTDMDFAMAAGF